MNNFNLDLNVDIALKKFNTDYIDNIKNELSKFKKYDLERLKIDDIHKCEIDCCLKNAIYLDRKKIMHLCWYHGLLLSRQN